MENSLPVKFDVTYRLREYLELVRAHTFATTIPLDSSKAQRIFYNTLLTVIGTVMFFYKSHRVGTCSFSLDAIGISRRSKGGEFSFPWSDVTAVYQYGAGYLIAKGKGAMPIPFRVMSEPQQKAVAAQLAPYLQERSGLTQSLASTRS